VYKRTHHCKPLLCGAPGKLDSAISGIDYRRSLRACQLRGETCAYDKAIFDGLTKANESAMKLFASVPSHHSLSALKLEPISKLRTAVDPI